MKYKVVYFFAVYLLLSSCSTTNRLYYWGTNGIADSGSCTKYEQLAYLNYEKQTPESVCALLCLYEDMVENPGGSRLLPPPGICAEYGYLLLRAETADIFEKYATDRQKRQLAGTDYISLFREKGLLMFQKEMELYPESIVFIEPLLDKLK